MVYVGVVFIDNERGFYLFLSRASLSTGRSLSWSAAFFRRFGPGILAGTGSAATTGSLRTSSPDWFCLYARIRLVSRNDFPFYFAFQELLDVAQQIVFLDTDQGYRLALLPGACCTPDTVYVIFRNERQFVIYDVR